MTIRYNGYILSPQKGSPGLTVIAFEGKGGKIPVTLSGAYTSVQLAKNDVDKYLESKACQNKQ